MGSRPDRLHCNEPPTAYGVLSLTDELVDLLPARPPVLVEAVLVPWRDVIVCDGLVTYAPVRLGASIKRSLKDAYREAKARGIVTSLGSVGLVPRKVPRRRTKPRPGAMPMPRQPTPRPKSAFVGSWELEGSAPGFMRIGRDGIGEFELGLLRGEMDCRFSTRDRRPRMEFTWIGADELDEVSGRGWAVVGKDGEMRGRLYRHLGDEFEFVGRWVE